MTDQEMRKLSRKELLEMLLEQTKRAEALQEQVRELTEKLENRTLALTEAGSIAEAALRLNGVFEAAQQAADQYLANIRQKSEEIEERCRRLETQTETQREQALRDSSHQECVWEIDHEETSEK